MASRPSKLVRAMVAVLCLAGVLWAAWRCGQRKPLAAQATRLPADCAQVALVNLGHCGWRVAFRSDESQEVSESSVTEGTSAKLTLKAGTYAVEQQLMQANGAAGPVRRFRIEFAPGKFYRWRLVDIFSDGQLETEVKPRREGAAHE